MQCVEYVDGIPMSARVNDTSCWENEDTAASQEAFTESGCRNIACLAMFLDVRREKGKGVHSHVLVLVLVNVLVLVMMVAVVMLVAVVVVILVLVFLLMGLVLVVPVWFVMSFSGLSLAARPSRRCVPTCFTVLDLPFFPWVYIWL